MKTVKTAALVAAALLALASCAPKTVIDGTLRDCPGGDVIVKLLDVSRYQVLDTVRTASDGTFRYRADIAKDNPEFIYLFYGDTKVASLLLQAGDHVKVACDTLGNYTVEGSEESLLLQEVENEYAQFMRDITLLSAREDPEASREISRRYVEHYRRSVRYVLEHPKSLTAVPVLYERVNDGLAVFGQPTDGIIFSSIADSLKTVYPESRYVKVLSQEGARRQQLMEFSQRVQNAGEIGYFDMDLPTLDGTRKKLSETEGKVVLLYFWTATAEQKMFNQDALLPLYRDFHGRGLEIYAVSLDVDKTAWASTVRNQELPWVNVCDTRGEASPLVNLYGLSSLPTVFFIVDGELDGTASVEDAASIRSYLQKKL